MAGFYNQGHKRHEDFAQSGLLLVSFAGLRSGAGSNRPAVSPGGPRMSRTRIILDVTRVNLLFTVTDKRGRFVTNLDKNDFSVREGKKPQRIMEFSRRSDLPFRLAILVDTSNSIRERFKFVQESAVEFVSSVMRPDKDKATVVSFDTAAELEADLTDRSRGT